MRHKRLAFSLVIVWCCIAILTSWMIRLLGVDVDVDVANAIGFWAYEMTLIALLFVAVYEYILMPVGRDRRNFTGSKKH